MKNLKIKQIYIPVIISGLLLLLASFYDYQLSNLLYSEGNVIARFFEAFGEAFGIIGPFAGAACIFASIENQKKKWPTITLTILAMIFSLMTLYEPYQFLDGAMKYVGVLAELICAILMFIYVYKNVDRSDSVKLKKIGTVIILTGIIGPILVNIVKIPWGRPRYRSIIVTDGLEFQPWWVVGKELRTKFEGILEYEEFKSFPSGHSSVAVNSICLVLLSTVVSSFNKKKMTIFAIVWTLSVMISRIVLGAHFLSDVVIGALISYLTFLLLCKIFKISESEKIK
jgi:membrane-associated phospholipid phosphatase